MKDYRFGIRRDWLYFWRLEPRLSASAAAEGLLFGMQTCALETFDAFFEGSFKLDTWCAPVRVDVAPRGLLP